LKILILGAGVVGTATAWFAAQDGHEVTVVDRCAAAGMETSFANGGQISACHAEPWAGPGAPARILQWLFRDDAPLLFRPRLDPAQWAWGLRFLYECTAWRNHENTARIAALGLYSRAVLRQLRVETGLAYDHQERGILHFFTDRRDFDAAGKSVERLRRLGLDREVKTVDEAVAIEPALAPARERLVGATYAASDESGDAHLFTQGLAARAAAKGVDFRYGHVIQGLRMAGNRVSGVAVKGPDGAEHTLAADAYVVALGSYSPLLTRPIGLDIPVYPAKGYSVTVDVADPAKAFTVSLTDDAAKLVFSRLGNRLRIAGTAELSGYSTQLNPVRCDAILQRVRLMFPGAGVYDRPTFWAGLRPSTPSNVPLIGATKIGNLYLNTGHGTLGWTLACGSGRALADILSGRKPDVPLCPP
jgi:D-amino-acid dehydrogenase